MSLSFKIVLNLNIDANVSNIRKGVVLELYNFIDVCIRVAKVAVAFYRENVIVKIFDSKILNNITTKPIKIEGLKNDLNTDFFDSERFLVNLSMKEQIEDFCQNRKIQELLVEDVIKVMVTVLIL